MHFDYWIYIGLVKIRLVMATTYLPLMLHEAQEFFFLEWRALGYTKLFVDVVGYATGFCTWKWSKQLNFVWDRLGCTCNIEGIKKLNNSCTQ